MQRLSRWTAFLTLWCTATAFAATAHAIETAATNAILIDADTDTVLFEKNANAQMHPASMSKLMTLYMLFDRLKQGTLSLKDKFTVSEKAWRKQGSKMFVHVGDQVSVEDLIRGIIIQSGNDACIVVAEGLMGSEEAFADAMNAKAKEIGLTNSHLTNSTGWPDPAHLMTAHDLAILAKRLMRDFPDYYKYFSEKEYTYSGIHQENRNMLLDRSLGVDGLKTGHSEESGYGITASGVRNGRRLILVINGTAGTVARAQEAEHLLQYGFLNYENVVVYKKGDTVDQVPVWLGQEATVPLAVDNDVTFTLPKQVSNKVSVKLTYNSPAVAPIAKGAHLGNLIVETPGYPQKTYPVIATKDVEKVGIVRRMIINAKYYLLRTY